MRFRLLLLNAIALCALPLAAQSLRDLAQTRGVHLGTAVNPALLDQPPYAEALAREFNQVEPENAMKFAPIQPGAETYNFAPADRIVQFAEQHHQIVRGHTMVWHRQNPAWLLAEKDPKRLADILHQHIQTVIGRYAGKVYAWDVVNEAIVDDGSLRHTLWSDAPGIGLPGTGYIEQALRWAHEADPKALLFYNDYDSEGLNRKSNAIYAMLKELKARGVPIDGVGLQMHLTLHPPTVADMEANINRLTDLGLQVQITELDVRVPVDSDGHASTADLATEARIYGEVVSLCLRYPKCTAIQLWGVTDKYSWIPHEFHNVGAPLLLDDQYAPKPAYTAVQQALASSKAQR